MNPVVKYFTGEKAESFLFLFLGIVGFIAGIYFILNNDSSFWKGFAVPCILVSLLEIVVGVTIVYRSPKDIIRVEHYIKNDSFKIKTDEIPRMKKVMRNFVVFRYTEIALILAGVIIYFYSTHDFWRGLGLGIMIQSSVVLALDSFAERRGFIYLEYLNSICHE